MPDMREKSRAGLRVGLIVIRVDDVQKQASFWSEALGYVQKVDRHDTNWQ